MTPLIHSNAAFENEKARLAERIRSASDALSLPGTDPAAIADELIEIADGVKELNLLG